MSHRESLDPIADLPAELAALDAELSAIRIAERASFAPELHAELHRQTEPAAEWIRPSSPARWGIVAASAARSRSGKPDPCRTSASTTMPVESTWNCTLTMPPIPARWSARG
jgi:hypothetical protein